MQKFRYAHRLSKQIAILLGHRVRLFAAFAQSIDWFGQIEAFVDEASEAELAAFNFGQKTQLASNRSLAFQLSCGVVVSDPAMQTCQ